MSTLEKDGLEACLFSRQDKKLVNIKFMRGKAKVIAPDDVRAAISSMVKQRDAGVGQSEPAKSGKPPVNLRKLFAGV
jgi:hypothetical protein